MFTADSDNFLYWAFIVRLARRHADQPEYYEVIHRWLEKIHPTYPTFC